MSRHDKKMERIEREFKRTHIILKKNKIASSKAKQLAKFAQTLSPEVLVQMLMTFIILSASSIHRKGIAKLLEKRMHPELWEYTEDLFEDIAIPEGLSLRELMYENNVAWR